MKSAVALYFALLAVSVVSMVWMLASKRSGLPAMGDLAASGAMALITLGWCIATAGAAAQPGVSPAPARPGAAFAGWMLLGAATAIPTMLISSAATAMLGRWFDVPQVQYLRDLTAEGYGLPFPVLLVCVMPAIFEELAFRGVMLSALEPVLGGREAMLVTALMFAILHLSVPSMPHLFLMGAALAWLRQRSGSLLPGMIAHFGHNFLVLLSEQGGGLLPW